MFSDIYDISKLLWLVKLFISGSRLLDRAVGVNWFFVSSLKYGAALAATNEVGNAIRVNVQNAIHVFDSITDQGMATK